MDELFDDRNNDQMLDDESITDLKTGLPFTDIMLITSPSIRSRPHIFLKLIGPAIDSCNAGTDGGSVDLMLEFSLQASCQVEDTFEKTTVVAADLTEKIREIGSTIYEVNLSPRGD